MKRLDLYGPETWAIVNELKKKHYKKMKQEERLAKASFIKKKDNNIK